MNKSLVTSVLTAIVVIIGYLTPVYQDQILSMGFFALSGAITNWLAVHMLFERVPFLYGSGVIPNRFEEFKASIKSLIMEQFFTGKNLDGLLESTRDAVLSNMSFDDVVRALDYDEVFNIFVELVLESPFGSLLRMVGGEVVLEPIRERFAAVLKSVLLQVTEAEPFLRALEQNVLAPQVGVELRDSVEEIVDQRLDELTPQMVKEILQGMIQQHLGWLVVWGGVFGGAIGLLMSLVK